MDILNLIPNNNNHKKRVKSLKAKANLHRSFIGKIIDKINEHTGTATFLVLNIIIFFLWIGINNGLIFALEPFDPYPYSFLTMTVSLEAIILSILVLISQNRDAKISDVREEVTLQILLTTEAETTKVLKMISQIQEKVGIKLEEDKELAKMTSKLNTEKITRDLEIEIESVD